MAIEKLSPALIYKIWGGPKLARMKKVEPKTDQGPLGETWEVSAHPQGPSYTSEGRQLSEFYTTEELPYLVKFIDTSENLSIQVHPDDRYASRVEGEKGKSECWFILEAEENAGIYLGLKEGVKRGELETRIRESRNVSELMNFYPVKSGDFFFVPAGTIHAIGEGVLLAEVQQCSGITYRVWDWNRLDKQGCSRELHIEKALDVIAFEADKNDLDYFSFIECKELKRELIHHRDFSVVFQPIKAKEKLRSQQRPSSIICLAGEVEIVKDLEVVKLGPFEAAVIASNIEYNVSTRAPRGTLSKVLYIF